MASITVALLIATLAFRSLLMFFKNENPKLKIAAFLLYGLAALAVSVTGFLGGNLVYGYMMPL